MFFLIKYIFYIHLYQVENVTLALLFRQCNNFPASLDYFYNCCLTKDI